jgi:hypothetical protein
MLHFKFLEKKKNKLNPKKQKEGNNNNKGPSQQYRGQRKPYKESMK